MFDSLNELREKFSLGEDSTIELKRELPERQNLADEIVALTNTLGGIILVGVDKDCIIFGIDRQHLDRDEQIVVDICWDIIKPGAYIVTEKLKVDCRNLLKIDVLRSQYVHRSSNGYFIRHGSSKRKMPTEESVREFQNSLRGRIIPFERQAVTNTHRDTLSKSLYQRFISKEATNRERIEELLLKRRLLVKDNEESRTSVAGVLMCHERPDGYIFNSFIQAVYYSGVEKDANCQIDVDDFRGPLDRQIVDTFKFVEKYNRVSTRKEIGRIDRPQYSMRAVFEALVNAVVHRDYSKYRLNIRLFMFSDRLELYSPGTLVNGLTLDNLPHKQAPRNELLARLLSEITLDDDMGTQVVRRDFLGSRGDGVGIVFNESETLSGKTPAYALVGEELRLTIFAAESLQEAES